MYLKPKNPEMVIRDPQSRVRLPAEGKNCPDSSFWRRRILDGDVVKCDPPKKPKAEKPAEAATQKKDS